MDYGVSVYMDSDFPLDKNIEYIELAKKLGYSTIFTSLHLPEIHYKEKLYEIETIFKVAKKHDMTIVADIAPRIMEVYGANVENLKPFKDIGVDILRIDYGFHNEDIISMSNNKMGIKIQINASTVTFEDLLYFQKMGANWENINACHNFYPRPNTGLDYDYFLEQSAMLKKFNLPVWAFIPSDCGKRGPIYEGLPSLESHRKISSYTAARNLAYTGLIDGIIFGDAYAFKEELEQVAKIDSEIVEIGIELFETVKEEEKEIIFLPFHLNREDSPKDIIRSEKSRGYARNGTIIKANNCIEREAFCVTIDNEEFKRYSGELQIVLKKMPADKRVNIVGKLCSEEHVLAKQISHGKKFRFRRG
jgi:hypothetical protein